MYQNKIDHRHYEHFFILMSRTGSDVTPLIVTSHQVLTYSRSFWRVMKRLWFKTQNQSFFLLYIVCCLILQFIHISLLSKSLSSTLTLHGFWGARTAFSDSALMRNNVLFVIPVSLLSAWTFKILYAATWILYRVRGSNLSGLRSNSLPVRHFYSQESMRENVSESIFEHANHERDRETNAKTIKMDFIGLKYHNRSTSNQI